MILEEHKFRWAAFFVVMNTSVILVYIRKTTPFYWMQKFGNVHMQSIWFIIN